MRHRLAWPRDPALAVDAAGSGPVKLAIASGAMVREAGGPSSGDGAALPRILRTYVAARAALGLALVLAPGMASLMGGRTPLFVTSLCLAYAGQAVSLWLLRWPAQQRVGADQLRPRQWLWTIGVDLLAFSLLRLLDPQAQLNHAALLVLPLLMAGVLTPRRVALATVAGVTLSLLLGAWVTTHEGVELLSQLSQAGLASAGMFLITLLASELAQRLVREERSARSSLGLARQQTLLNRLVIDEMADGVIVVDRQGQVRSLNPAARALLGPVGQAVPWSLAEQAGLLGLQQALMQAFQLGSWPPSAGEISLVLADGDVTSLQVRARFTQHGGGDENLPPEDFCVLFLQDMRSVRAQARQDKLAAMGRVSAAMAHEIRNPLAAISQANALLLEDELPAAQRQLARIVADNAWRLKRMVEDVLAVAPSAPPLPVVIDARTEVELVCADWCRAAPPETRAHERLVCELPAKPMPVFFDAEHLRRVLVNLLDNAARHAGPLPGALRLRLADGSGDGSLPGRVALSLASDGAPIDVDVERHLFEPFFSSRSRGTGLGLYICRELCELHGASIEFSLGRPVSRHRNVFAVVMRAAPAA